MVLPLLPLVGIAAGAFGLSLFVGSEVKPLIGPVALAAGGAYLAMVAEPKDKGVRVIGLAVLGAGAVLLIPQVIERTGGIPGVTCASRDEEPQGRVCCAGLSQKVTTQSSLKAIWPGIVYRPSLPEGMVICA